MTNIVREAVLFLISFFIAQCALADSAFFTFENDCLLKHSDNDYSAGVELKYITDDNWYFKLQQNMYTPNSIRIKEHIKGDRPYAGALLGAVGKELFVDPDSPWSHYVEGNFGMIGPASCAEYSQKIIHKLLDCHMPQGWDNQIHNEFVVNGQWWTRYNWFLCDYVAIVPRGGVAAGTIQDFLDVGVDLKIGWNMRRKEIGINPMFSATQNKPSWKEKLSFWVYGGVGERYYLYNHFLEGSMFGHRDDDLKVDIEPFVSEAHVGAVLQYDKFFITWYGIFRTDEYKHQKESPNYGGLSIGLIW